jgi:L-iditol 2-dehydrogenase
MRAAVLHAPGDLRVEDLTDPEPGPGEVVLRIDAAATCGTDRKSYARGHPALGALPARLGHEFAGTIVAVGDDVDRFAEGDQVYCANSAPCGECFHCASGRLTLCEDLLFLFGGFAERLLVPARIVERNLHSLPGGLAMEIAPITEPLACAVRAVDLSGTSAGDRVAVVGGGALGLMLAAVIADLGGEPIVADPHPHNRDLARRFGAVEVIEARKDDSDARRVRELTDGRGADQVFEAVGRPEVWELAVTMARSGGTVNLFGGCPVGSTFTVPTYRVHYEEVRLQGTFHHTPAHIRAALDLLGRLAVPWGDLLGHPIDLEDLASVLRDGSGAPKDLVLPNG